MRRIIFFVCIITSICISAKRWEGKLELNPQTKLRLVFNIDNNSFTLDSPDQNAYGIRGDIEYYASDSLSVSIPQLQASYTGCIYEDRIVGTFTQGPYSLSLKLHPAKLNRPQTPQAPFPYLVEQVYFHNPKDNIDLAGSLTLPSDYSNETPIVVLVSGSGLQNRDEEIFDHKPFAVIADHLARNGIASLRYDDRGYGLSTGDPTKAKTSDFANDAAAAIEYLHSEYKFKNIGIIGHSEGGSIAIMLAAQHIPNFIITLAAPLVRGDSILVDQSVYTLRESKVPEIMIEQYKIALSALYEIKIEKGIDNVVTYTDYLTAQWPRLPIYNNLKENLRQIAMTDTPWLNEFIAYSPQADIDAIKCPALLLYGEYDVQVRPELNVPTLNATLTADSFKITKIFPKLNHLMQEAPTGSPSEYSTIEQTISPLVLNEITAFIYSNRYK